MAEGFGKDFRRFFLRGLAAVLPTLLTIMIIVWVFVFVQDNIGEYINRLVIWLVCQYHMLVQGQGLAWRHVLGSSAGPASISLDAIPSQSRERHSATLDAERHPRESPILELKVRRSCGKLPEGLGRKEKVRPLRTSPKGNRTPGVASGIRLGLRVQERGGAG